MLQFFYYFKGERRDLFMIRGILLFLIGNAIAGLMIYCCIMLANDGNSLAIIPGLLALLFLAPDLILIRDHIKK